MPRIALVVLGVLGGCSFDANYADGAYRCSDNICPDDLVCVLNLDGDYVCREPFRDAAVDAPGDGVIVVDGPPAHMLNCDDPQPLTNDEPYADSTKARTNKLSTTCTNQVMYGYDRVHVITPGAGKYMTVTIDAAHAATAYVLSACPQTACNGNVYATPSVPRMVYTLAGPHYIVVDSLAANVNGPYTLTVSY
jgi:hypothetical protein